MKKLLISLAAASALAAVAAPAAAQNYGGYGRDDDFGYGRGYDYVDRGDRLELRIQRAVERGRISGREAYRLRSEVRMTERLAWRYRRDGAFTRWERADIDRRYDRIATLLRYERTDRDYGYGYGPRY